MKAVKYELILRNVADSISELKLGMAISVLLSRELGKTGIDVTVLGSSVSKADLSIAEQLCKGQKVRVE